MDASMNILLPQANLFQSVQACDDGGNHKLDTDILIKCKAHTNLYASLLVLLFPNSNDFYLKMDISETGTRLFLFKALGFKIKRGFYKQILFL